MRARELPFALDPQAAEPLFLQLARAIVQDVRRGRLRRGRLQRGLRQLQREEAICLLLLHFPATFDQ